MRDARFYMSSSVYPNILDDGEKYAPAPVAESKEARKQRLLAQAAIDQVKFNDDYAKAEKLPTYQPSPSQELPIDKGEPSPLLTIAAAATAGYLVEGDTATKLVAAIAAGLVASNFEANQKKNAPSLSTLYDSWEGKSYRQLTNEAKQDRLDETIARQAEEVRRANAALMADAIVAQKALRAEIQRNLAQKNLIPFQNEARNYRKAEPQIDPNLVVRLQNRGGKNRASDLTGTKTNSPQLVQKVAKR